MKAPRAGLYDRWFSVLGGGERAAVVMMQALRALGFQVDLITHDPVSADDVHSRFHLDMSGISVVLLPWCDASELSAVSAQYDLFVNASYLDYFPMRAKATIHSVMFPSALPATGASRWLRQWVFPLLERELAFFRHVWQRLGERPELWVTLSRPSCMVSVDVAPVPMTSSLVESLVATDEQERPLALEVVAHHPANKLRVHVRSLQPTPIRFVRLRSTAGTATSWGAVVPAGVDGRTRLSRVLLHGVPALLARLRGGNRLLSLAQLGQPDALVTNSRYTSSWIARYWHQTATVVYPPVQLVTAQAAKKPIILSVGRFITRGHRKHQEVLLAAFIDLCRRYPDLGWELHCAGGLGTDSESQAFIAELQRMAEGYPVVFHANCDQTTLTALIAQSQIYWQATGYGEDEKRHPERAEHFGITTVEAMSAGCVPLVYPAGGVPEVVTAACGFTWKTTADLVLLTQELIADESRRHALARRARQQAEHFSEQAFVATWQQLVQKLCREKGILCKRA